MEDYIDWWDFIGRANSIPKPVKNSFAKCSIDQVAIDMWLNDHQFVTELYSLRKKSIHICDETVLPIMKDLISFRKSDPEFWEEDGFSFKIARASVRRIKKAIINRQQEEGNV